MKKACRKKIVFSLANGSRKGHLPRKKMIEARHRWLMPVILANQEAEIRRITVRRQPGEIVCETLSRKTLYTKGW
jgi:hypothetical protein